MTEPVQMIRLLVRANAVTAMADAAMFGVRSARISRVRANNDLVMVADMAEFDAILRWWRQAGTLVRTLGPTDDHQGAIYRRRPLARQEALA